MGLRFWAITEVAQCSDLDPETLVGDGKKKKGETGWG